MLLTTVGSWTATMPSLTIDDGVEGIESQLSICQDDFDASGPHLLFATWFSYDGGLNCTLRVKYILLLVKKKEYIFLVKKQRTFLLEKKKYIFRGKERKGTFYMALFF